MVWQFRITTSDYKFLKYDRKIIIKFICIILSHSIKQKTFIENVSTLKFVLYKPKG